MVTFVKMGIIISCIVLFSDIMGFAQRNDIPNVSTPELSKMIKDQDGLISSTEMQTLHKGKTKSTFRQWVGKKTDKSSDSDTQVTGR